MRDLELSEITAFESMFETRSNFPPKEENSFSRSYSSILEFTVNLSKSEGEEKDRKKYLKIFSKCMLSFPKIYIDFDVVFEKCKSGKLHMHGVIYIKKDINFFIEGLVLDLARSFLKAIDGRLKLNEHNNFYRYLARYRSPILCIQYSDEPERFEYWETYIKKDQI